MTNTLKLCDFGISALVTETYFPPAFTLRYSSPYRLSRCDQNRLIPEEDVYALSISLWELMTGRKAFDDVDDEDELEEGIRKGRQVNVDEVENEEVRTFIRSCLRIFETKS